MVAKLHKILTVVVGAASILLMPGLEALKNQPNQSFSWQTAAWANTPFQYAPPNRGTPKRTQGTGSRGCNQSLPVSLNLLVPNDHNGQTISGHPTFYWYVSDKVSVPVEFALVQPGVAKPLFVQQIQVEKGGMMQVTLPKTLPELATGQKYRWSVSLVCDSNRPSNNVFVQSWIERVSANADLTRNISALQANGNPTNLLQEQGRIYARAGLWYNALEAFFSSYTANPNDPSSKADFLSLLEQGGLTQISATERQRLASQ